MVPQRHQERLRLVLGRQSEAYGSGTVPSKVDSIPSGLCPGAPAQEGNRTSSIPTLPGSSVLRRQSQLLQEESNSGLVDPQQTHPLRQVQDAHYRADTDPTTQKGLQLLCRSYRRILACADSTPSVPLPWILPGASGLCVQDYALRSKYCAESFHQTGQSGNPGAQETGDPGSRLSGRLVDLGPITRRMSPSDPESDQLPTTSGVSDQLQKVQTDAPDPVHLARPQLGPGVSYPLLTVRQEAGNSQDGPSSQKTKDDDEKATRKSPWVPTICCHHRPSPQSQIEGHEQGLDEKSEQVSPRPEKTFTEAAVQTAAPVVILKEPVTIHTAEASTFHSDHPHGCLPKRMGRPLPSQDCSRRDQEHVSTGEVVYSIPVVSYKHPRSTGSVLNAETCQPKTGLSCSLNDGQQHDCALYKSLRVEITANQSRDLSHSPPLPPAEVASDSCTPGGGQERHSRRSLQNSPSGVGMDARSSVLPVYTDPGSRSPNRSIRYGGEPSAPALRSPEYRPPSCRSRRSVVKLEPVGENLHLPSHELNAQGPRQTEDLPGHSRSGSPTVAQEQLVPAPPSDETTTGTSPCADPDANSSAKACLRLILADPEITLDRFLKFAMGRFYNMKEENVVFLENYKALSTERQYESNWKKWMAYVTTHQPSEITVDFCVSFLKSLHEKGLASSTINTLKSALTVPIRYGFGIKWNEEPFINLVKSCAAQRP